MTRVKGTSNTEKKIMMFKFKTEDHILTYCEQGYKYITKEEFTKIRSNPLTEDYLLVNHNKLLNCTLQKQFKLFINTADFLKELTNGEINMYKTGSISKSSLQLFYNSCNPPKPDKITQQEAIWIRNCRGQLKYAINYVGKGWKLDVVSEYPSIMRSDHFQVPIKEGKFITLTKEEFNDMKYFKYGIYRVKIITRVNPFIFRPNDKNYYTHTDLNFAKTLNYEMELIEDNQENFLSYEGCLINSAKLFRPFIDYLFKFKSMKYKTIKEFINRLWGALCKKNVISVDNEEVKQDREILQFCPMEDDIHHSGHLKVDVINKESFFETDFARLKPFLLAKARYVTAQYISKNINDVVYVNTDGYIINKKPSKDLQFGTNIGDLKLEEYSDNIEVFHSNKVVGYKKVEIDPFEQLENDKKLFEKK